MSAPIASPIAAAAQPVAKSVDNAAPHSDGPRSKCLFDEQWRFQLGDVAGAEAAGFDDGAWRTVDLPHDWSIELPRDPKAPTGGAGGFFQNGIGWYRKTLAVDPARAGQRVVLEFEGVYCNAEVFVNGQHTGVKQPYGYVPFSVDLSEAVQAALAAGGAAPQPITVAVRVDNERQPSSRWFTGSGIYRHVWLHTFSPTHIATDDFKLTTTSLSAAEAVLRVEAGVVSATQSAGAVSLDFAVYAPDGAQVAQARAAGELAGAATRARIVADLKIPAPQAWSPDSPSLYRVVAQLRGAQSSGRGGNDTAPNEQVFDLLDEVTVTTGLRTLAWSAERGLLLNGQPIKLNGGNVHHDNGILGAAAFDRAEERKVELMKAAGFNAVRTAHNPHSIAFLNACDRLGLLVLDDMFDGWAEAKTAADYHLHFAEWYARDVEAWIRRDWNHPAVIFWCIGNEVFERGKPEGVAIAKKLAALVRSLDASRPVTSAVNGAWGEEEFWKSLDPFFAELDVGGYNYELASRDTSEREPGRSKFHKLYPRLTHVRDHERVPQRLMVATESFQSEVFANWQATRDHSYVLGDFVWTALDYLGESTIGVTFPPGLKELHHWEHGTLLGWPWPWAGAYCGDIDLTGWRKPVSYYREIVWNGEKAGARKLYMAVQEPPPQPQSGLSGAVPATPPIAAGEAEVPAPEEAWRPTLWAMAPALPLWDWPQSEGKWLTVEVYSRYDSVRLYLNGQLVGEKPTGEAEEFAAQFRVRYAAGELVAAGVQGGEERERFALKTGGPAVALRASVDRDRSTDERSASKASRPTLSADGQDLAFVTIEAVDAAGQWQPWAAQKIDVQVSGAGRLAGLGTGNVRDSLELYTGSACTLFQGRALAVIRAGKTPGPITLRISAPGLGSTELELHAD
ncbi:glycoside hydrolase family 2 TIM barrel-domain containing protein [Cephaloticoccus primus]|nr:glycoside hydrolase family 2 TIM barrel-domain containing protein [Cephaloticoccus primus]